MEEWYGPVTGPEPDLRQERRNISRICLGFALMLFLTVAGQVVLAAAVAAVCPAFQSSGWYIWCISMVPAYCLGAPVCWLVVRTRRGAAPQGSAMSLKGFFVCLLMCFGLLYPLNLVGRAANHLVSALLGVSPSDQLQTLVSSSELYITFLFTVVLAPLMEELLFRRLLAGSLARYGQGVAVLVSGLMFGLYHGNLNQFFYAAALGMLFAYIYLNTGRVIITVLLHAGVNFLGSVVPILLGGALELYEDYGITGDLGVFSGHVVEAVGMAVFSVGVLAMTAAGVALLIRRRRSFVFRPGAVTLPRGQRAGTVLLNAGMLLFLAGCAGLFVLSFF